MKIRFVVFFALFFSFSAKSQIISDSISDAVEEDRTVVLEDKIEKLERQFELFSKKMLKSSAESSRKRGDTASPEIYLDQIQIRVDRLEENVRNYVDEIERLNNKIDSLGKRIDKINDDYKVRFELLEKSKPAAQTVESQDIGEQSGQRKQMITEEKTVSGAIDDVDALYKDAIDHIKKNDYASAENNLKIIVEKYPKHPLSSNAMYWLGETYYVRADYKNAVKAFGDGIKKYGNGQKGPDSLLKLGISYKNLKKNKEACTAFAGLPLKYKKASKDLLSRARKEAADLKCSKIQ